MIAVQFDLILPKMVHMRLARLCIPEYGRAAGDLFANQVHKDEQMTICFLQSSKTKRQSSQGYSKLKRMPASDWAIMGKASFRSGYNGWAGFHAKIFSNAL